MEELNEAMPYERIHNFINQFTYTDEEGTEIEIKEIFFHLHAENKITDFTLLFHPHTHHYRVIVALEECSTANAHAIFWSLIRFISYANATIFAKKQTEHGFHYIYASFAETGRGFYVEVDFLDEETRTKAEENQEERKDTNLGTSILSSTSQQRPAIQWQYQTNSFGHQPPIVAQNITYTVGNDQDIYAIDAEQGSLQWLWEPSSTDQFFHILSLPRVDNGCMYVPVHSFQDGERTTSLCAINIQTGQILRHFPLPFLYHTGAFNFLTVYKEVAYLSGADRNTRHSSPDRRDTHIVCQAIDLQTGREKWLIDLGASIEATVPVIAHERIYLVTFAAASDQQHSGHLHALNAHTGKKIWQYTFKRSGALEIAIVDTDIFLVSTTLEVIDAMSGERCWSLPDMGVVLKGTPLVDDERVYLCYERTLPDTNELKAREPHEMLLAGGPPRIGGILAVDRTSQKLLWQTELPQGDNHITTDGAVIADGILYVVWDHLDMRGCVTHATLYALDTHTGLEHWRFEAENLSAPFAVNGRVFVQGRQGEDFTVYCLS